ncbi:MAG: hypothetical protein IPM49_18205 [Flavobacteriales bacterium]|nr:hypothetical protein [Flavobacteriales bacterium]
MWSTQIRIRGSITGFIARMIFSAWAFSMGLKPAWSTQAALYTVRKSSASWSTLRPRASRMVKSGSFFSWLYLRWKIGCAFTSMLRLKKSCL